MTWSVTDTYGYRYSSDFGQKRYIDVRVATPPNDRMNSAEELLVKFYKESSIVEKTR